MTIGQWVRTQRQARGWTQLELAFQSHISPRLIALWEAGTHEPSFGNIVKLTGAFGEAPPILDMAATTRRELESPFFLRADQHERRAA